MSWYAMAAALIAHADPNLGRLFGEAFAARVAALTDEDIARDPDRVMDRITSGWEVYRFPDYPAAMVRTEHGWAYLPDAALPDRSNDGPDEPLRYAQRLRSSPSPRTFVFASLGDFATAVLTTSGTERLRTGAWAALARWVTTEELETLQFLHALGRGLPLSPTLFNIRGLALSSPTS